MTTTSPLTEKERFDHAISETLRLAAQNRDVEILYGAARRGFAEWSLITGMVAKAEQAGSFDILRPLAGLGFSRAQDAINALERANRQNPTRAPKDSDTIAAMEKAERAFERAARSHFNKDANGAEATGLARFTNAHAFDRQAAAYQQAKREPADDRAKNWPI